VLKGELTLKLGSRLGLVSADRGTGTVTSPLEAGVIKLSTSISATSLCVSTNGVIPARREFLSGVDRGIDKSGIVSTSGIRRRVPRKIIKLAKPSTRQPCQTWQ
jgi:hypothetical protein